MIFDQDQALREKGARFMALVFFLFSFSGKFREMLQLGEELRAEIPEFDEQMREVCASLNRHSRSQIKPGESG